MMLGTARSLRAMMEWAQEGPTAIFQFLLILAILREIVFVKMN